MKPLFALFVCGFSFLSQAQDATPPPDTATLAGTVVKEPGSQPLKKVLLHLIAEDQNQGGNYTTDTDPDGHFRIERVQPGRYRLLLEKTGFHVVNLRGHESEGAILNVQAGQEINDLLFQMQQAAVIAGRVVDEDGDPLPNFSVSLLKRRPGKARPPEIANTERTNDLGEYRFGGLFPGQYLVVVVPVPDTRGFEHLAKESAEKTSRQDLNYLVTYYPGTTDSSQASAISLGAGDEIPVNFTMIPGRTYRVRGIVTGIPANQKPMVQMMAKGINNAMNGADVAPDGSFEVRGVAPGSYSITAYSSSEGQFLTARQGVTVVAADVEGLKLVPTRPFTVSGELHYEGRPKDLTQYTVSLQPLADADDPGFIPSLEGASNVQASRSGEFQWTHVTPGNYVVEVFGGGGNEFLKRVTLGDSNAETGLTLTGSTSVELVIGTRGGMLEGVVLEHDKTVPNATVVAVPEEKFRQLHQRFGASSTDQNGHFAIRGLAPGAYALFAWQDLDGDLYHDAAFLKAQESNGVAVKVEEGSRQKIELKVSPVGEDWQ